MTSEDISHRLRVLAEMHARGDLNDDDFFCAFAGALYAVNESGRAKRPL